jgi:bla regulator protein blaR1
MSDLLSNLAVSTLSCSAAIVLILSMRKWMTRQFGAEAAYAVWALVPLASLATLLPARSVVLVVKAIPVSPQIAATMIGDIGASTFFAPQFDGGIGVAAWLCGIWIVGMAGTLLLFLRQHRRFVRRLGRLDPVADNLYRAQATRDCPALVGVWQPRIVVPVDFEARYSASERELILAHERHHLARGDASINALGAALRSVFWFNPLVHFAAACFMADQELACDAAVMARFPNTRRVYANAMMKAQSGDFRAALACHWPSRNLLKERIALLAHPSIARSRRWLGNFAAVAMIVTGSVAAWASQPVETRTRYENAMPIETSAAGETDASGAPASGPDLAAISATNERVVSIPRLDEAVTKASASHAKPAFAKSIGATGKSKRNVVAASHGTVPHGVASESQRKPTPTLAGVASEGSTDTVRGMSVARASAEEAKTDVDRTPREIASYRRDHAPKYPAAAVRAHIEGKVMLDVGVDQNGNPTDAHVASLQPSTATELASASLAAVTRWQFEPAQHAGRAVASRLAVPFVFALNGEGAYAAPEARRQASYRTLGSASYPADLAGAEGVVYVRVRIEGDGTVSSSEIDRVDPPSATGLGASALSALKAWTFNPARAGDKAVASTVVVPIVFSANTQSSPGIARIRNGLDPIRVTPKRS